MGTRGIVLVKSFPNQPIVRYITGDSGEYVFICLEHEFHLWEQKSIRPLTVKCPKASVFEYDEELFKKLKEAAYTFEDQILLDALWEKARIYDCDRTLAKGVSSNVT